MPLPDLFNQVAVVLDGPLGQRREVGGPAPSWQQEELAQQRLIKLDLMSGLLDCILIYYRLAHSDSSLGLRLMNYRKLLWCPTRPQAIGKCALTQSPSTRLCSSPKKCAPVRSGNGCDLDLGLRTIIESKFGMPIETLFETFMRDSGYNDELWSVKQVRSTQSVPLTRCTLSTDERPSRLADATHRGSLRAASACLPDLRRAVGRVPLWLGSA